MKIPEMIEELVSRGWTQRAIARQIGVSQPTVHRAAAGGAIFYDTGKAIERLYEQVTSHKASDEAA
ncbi:hypothetical protein D9M69_462350 [compost metagenome]